MSYVCPYCNCFSSEDYIWWVSSEHGDGSNRKKKLCSWWCADCGDQYDWRAPSRILVRQTSANANEAKVFKAHAAPLELCDNLVRASKLLTNQQKERIVTGFREKSHGGIMERLRNFIEVDNHTAVDVGACVEVPRRSGLGNSSSVMLTQKRLSQKAPTN